MAGLEEAKPGIRVVLVDDHTVVRTGMAALLSAAPDVTVAAVASDAATGAAAVLERRPDVTLMDLSLPDGTGSRRSATSSPPGPPPSSWS